MENEKLTYHKTLYAMATRMDLVLINQGTFKGDQIAEEIQKELIRLENKFSYFKKNSIISNINRRAYQEEIMVDNETFDVLLHCKSMFYQTHTYFNIGARPLLEYFMQHKDYQDTGEITKLKNAVSLENLTLIKARLAVRLDNNQIKLDLGGYGKGYALDQIRKILLKNECTSAFISFGESSVLAHGQHPYGAYWGIAIPNPFSNDAVHTFKTSDGFVSTSGITEANLKKHAGTGHIINPVTGLPLTGLKTLAAKAKTGVVSEVASTSLILCEPDERQIILSNLGVEEAIEIIYKENGANHQIIKIEPEK